MPKPDRQPLGVDLARTAKAATRAFDDALAAAGGSRPVWLILISLKTRAMANQRELAEAVGIQGATLTHHLNAMESAGLITRRRDPANRRVHLVELTAAGDTTFHALRTAAVEHDRRLRDGLSDADQAELARLLARLRENVAPA
ncbi:MarR family winged helix-turn-helix transcriptional regulator [Actinocatenispora rupis]|uniref:Transcriptional regulator n=1 Tax=Actinocatenispora rupis TaxID=519421 RepID=A0A8J3J313_9ACTN|nr:MarR family transcriptional regulator [Actinocatenispora rupis]GID10666.1 transcriptional regulator [Actinocatenispora rupis]